jgi:hypothetical protein
MEKTCKCLLSPMKFNAFFYLMRYTYKRVRIKMPKEKI